jgi:hypothetical protein
MRVATNAVPLPVLSLNFPPDLPFGSLAAYPGFGNVVRSWSMSQSWAHSVGGGNVKKLSDYFLITAAADYLGVSPNTLRNGV